MTFEKVHVDLRGLSQTQLDQAYEMAREIDPQSLVLYVDERVYNSSLAPKRHFYLKKDRPPVNAENFNGLKMMLHAVRVADQAKALLDTENVQVEKRKLKTMPVMAKDFNDEV